MNGNPRRYWTGEEIGSPGPQHKDCILVYGANTERRNGFGVALTARQWGASPFGDPRGLTGRAYALVTKNLKPNYLEQETGTLYRRYGRYSVPKAEIRQNIETLYSCAREHSDKWFIVPYKRSNKNLNGYSSNEIFELFTKDIDVPPNMVFHESFKM